MKKLIFLCLSCVLLLSSCANTYNLLEPNSANFSPSDENSSELKTSYSYLNLKKKYLKKSIKNNVRLASVKIENNSEKAISYGKDFGLFTIDNAPLSVLDTNETYDLLRQKPGTHLWYLLLSLIQFHTTTTDGSGSVESSSSFPIGAVVGVPISIGNMLVASSANSKFKGELSKYEIQNSTIEAGETKTFIVSIKNTNYPSILAKTIN